MEKVIVTVSPTGEVTVKVECVKGARCSEVSKEIEWALGSRTKDVVTSEMSQKGTVDARN